MEKMKNVILLLVATSFGDLNWPRVIECLQAMRKSAVEVITLYYERTIEYLFRKKKPRCLMIRYMN